MVALLGNFNQLANSIQVSFDGKFHWSETSEHCFILFLLKSLIPDSLLPLIFYTILCNSSSGNNITDCLLQSFAIYRWKVLNVT